MRGRSGPNLPTAYDHRLARRIERGSILRVLPASVHELLPPPG